jgi:hypothetical protein
VNLYTLDRNFNRIDIIDGFHSAIWNEKYLGDSNIELVVPATTEMIELLPEGIFVGSDSSDEVMILEALTIDDGKLKAEGNSLLVWLNNRFVRYTPNQDARTFQLNPPMTPGAVVWEIVRNSCHRDSVHLQPGATTMGISNPEQLAIQELDLLDIDNSGDPITFVVEYQPVYDCIHQIASDYNIGMQLLLGDNPVLGFRSYKGVDRTTGQTEVPPVRFSPQMDSLTNISEFRSIAALKTKVWAFTGSDMGTLNSQPPGEAHLTDQPYVGFDLRAMVVTAGEIQAGDIGTDAAKLASALNIAAKSGLASSPYDKLVDGEIVPTAQFQYGRDYTLGDIVEIQGHSEIIGSARVTEYIRTQDETGEKAYPTVTMLD